MASKKMTTLGSSRFARNLVAAFGGKASADQIALYEEKLSKWHLDADDWSWALSRIISDLDNQRGLPELATIYKYLKAVRMERSPTAGCHMQSFDWKGRRYSRKISDPSMPPPLPDGATNQHITIGSPLPDQPDDLVSGTDARCYFAYGFTSAGGRSSLLDCMFGLATMLPDEAGRIRRQKLEHISTG